MQTLTIRETRQDIINRLDIVKTSLRLTNVPSILSSIEDNCANEVVEELLMKKRLLEIKLKRLN